jgi:hypothetical protein
MRTDRVFEQMLAFHCAPTLAGIKASSLITVQKHKVKNFVSLLSEYEKCLACKGMGFEVLRENSQSALVLLYRHNALAAILTDEKNETLLSSLGYEGVENVDTCLLRLKQKMQTGEGFPHEIGLLLGYPLTDVCGFIENRGQNFKLCGYWKVYSDLENSKVLFEQYERCSTDFCQYLQNGSCIADLACAV